MSFIYLGQPYSHPDQAVREQRYQAALAETARLMQDGITVYSPIIHGHAISAAHDLPQDWEFWRVHCIPMLAAASQLRVLKLDGWAISKGLEHEIKYASGRGIPVFFCNPRFA
jgi:hypothetical protein